MADEIIRCPYCVVGQRVPAHVPANGWILCLRHLRPHGNARTFLREMPLPPLPPDEPCGRPPVA